MENKLIFSQRLAGYLMMRGFILINMRPNNDGSGKNVFFFKTTPELESAINEYKKNN